MNSYDNQLSNLSLIEKKMRRSIPSRLPAICLRTLCIINKKNKAERTLKIVKTLMEIFGKIEVLTENIIVYILVCDADDDERGLSCLTVGESHAFSRCFYCIFITFVISRDFDF